MQKDSKNILSPKEKQELRRRIMESARKADHQRKWKFRRRVLTGAAACLAFLVGLTFYYRQPATPGIEDFVKSAPDVRPNAGDQVTIVLGQGKNLTLDTDQARVAYSESGTDVRVGNQTVKQEALRDNKPTYNTILVPYGKRTDLKLSDGTVVWLNSGTKLVYPAVFNEENREVYLEGEAIFDVAHNPQKPFRVLSEHQRIEVLGTVFNVSSYPEDVETSTVLKSGSVRVSYSGKKGTAMRMTPGMRSAFNSRTQKVSTQQVDPEDYFSWREGFLSLRNHSLGEIATKLSRYYNRTVRIEHEGLAQETFSGKLDLKENVESVIGIISDATEIQYRVTPEAIVLTK